MYVWAMKLIVLLLLFFSISSSQQQQDCTDVARDDEPLLVMSTLGGGLTALDMASNEIKWSIEDEWMEKPGSEGLPLPQYLPDPRDGSLYQLGNMGGIKKMPYTIPELVASAPCRSSDGILYSGRKSDTWFLVDPKTGHKEKIFDFASSAQQLKDNSPKFSSRSVYLGRTQYNVLMYDGVARGKKGHSWNVTFFDYSAHTMSPEISKDYEWLHVTDSSTGNVATLNRKTGALLWERSFSSPVVGVFVLTADGLLTVPFTPVSESTLQSIVDYAKTGNQKDLDLFQSLYVGEHNQGLFAMPSMTDQNTPLVTADAINLLAGPTTNDQENAAESPSAPGLEETHHQQEQNQNKNENSFILLGYYKMPEVSRDSKLMIGPSPTVMDKDLMTVIETGNYPEDGNNNNFLLPEPPAGGQSELSTSSQVSFDKIFNVGGGGGGGGGSESQKFRDSEKRLQSRFRAWLKSREDKYLELVVIVLCGVVIFLVFYLRNFMNEVRQQSRNGSQSGGERSGSFGNASGDCSPLELLDNGDTKVGKIQFNPNDLLGKGCEGTFVFKGKFENRDVAVKRLLPECFTLADREVALLRESDTHENVVRYFCTENDRQFRYIALELCTATLQDYVESARAAELQAIIDPLVLLRQAASGLAHLHTLNIVHRDIKPQNVLVSFPDVHNKVRAMISDFGLCKKLSTGKASFSKRSGITGTDGWIAPEMIAGRRTTTSVDIFSLGCVFYYVLTKGRHPFGENMKRQANILGAEFNLEHLFGAAEEEGGGDGGGGETHTSVLAEEMIRDMINDEAHFRPTARGILNHPLFWPSERILSFLQDVSDRVEKAQPSTEPLRTLEKNAALIVKEDWNTQLEPEITNDLRKFRGYQGGSVRDLLRALRNKKHHYHELDREIQQLMGNIPHNFTHYWIGKFPRLLSHSYHALERCSHEPSFQHYYAHDVVFSKPEYFAMPEESAGALDVNWRQTQGAGGGGGGGGDGVGQSAINWRSGTAAQGSPVKKSKKGAYNFRRPGEDGGATGGTAATTAAVGEAVKRRKFYPRKD